MSTLADSGYTSRMFDNFNLLDFARDHWPFLVVALILGVIGEVAKKIVTPNGSKGLKGWRWVWNVTLPLHAVCIGFALGLLPFMTCPDSVCGSVFERGLYYAASGAFSSYVYAGVKHFAKEKLGSDAPLPSVVPPAP